MILKYQGLAAVWQRLTKRSNHKPALSQATRLPLPAPGKNSRPVLVIDAYTPTPDFDSGSLRMTMLMQSLVSLGYHVTFIPADLNYQDGYTQALEQSKIRCLYQPHLDSILSFLQTEGHSFELVILSRADTADRYIRDARQYCTNASIWFDTVDLQYVREQRMAALAQSRLLTMAAHIRKIQELNIARQADLTLVVSPLEKVMLAEAQPQLPVAVISNIHDLSVTDNPFNARQGLVFISNFGHPPNTDALEFFLIDIVPLLRQSLPDIPILIVGANPPARLTAQTGPGIEFTGLVKELAPLFNKVRLSVAPLRFGAGVKGKINTSMAHGVPVVATSIAAEGMTLVDGDNILVADAPDAFAAAIVRLHEDETLWQQLSAAGQINIRDNFSSDVARKQLQTLLNH